MTETETPRRPRVIAAFSQKGGVGKTTTASNIAVVLAAAGKEVILMDLDSQGNVTSSFCGQPAPLVGTYDFLIGAVSFAEAWKRTPFANLSIIPATKALAGMELEFASFEKPQFALRDRLASVSTEADYIIIDCPPALGLLPVNALVAASSVIIPVQCEPFAHDGLINTLYSINKIQSNLNPGLTVHGFLLTMISGDDITRKMAAIIRREFGSRVYATEISRAPEVAAAAARDIPLTVFDPECLASIGYVGFVAEFLARERSMKNVPADMSASAPEQVAGAAAAPNILEFNEMVFARLRKWKQALEKQDAPSFIDDSVPSRQAKAGVLSASAPPWPETEGEQAPVRKAALFILVFVIGVLAGIAFAMLIMAR